VLLCKFSISAPVQAQRDGNQQDDSQLLEPTQPQGNGCDQRDGNYFRSNVIYNEKSPNLRLSRPNAPATNINPAPVQTPAQPSKLPAVVKQTPIKDRIPSKEQTPIADKESAQKLLQQSLEATIYACNYLILTGVNSRQMTVQEELEARAELEQVSALAKSYAAQGYTADTFNEIQRKLVVLQLHIYTYGTNAVTR
jgi:hypothetical protein